MKERESYEHFEKIEENVVFRQYTRLDCVAADDSEIQLSQASSKLNSSPFANRAPGQLGARRNRFQFDCLPPETS